MALWKSILAKKKIFFIFEEKNDFSTWRTCGVEIVYYSRYWRGVTVVISRKWRTSATNARIWRETDRRPCVRLTDGRDTAKTQRATEHVATRSRSGADWTAMKHVPLAVAAVAVGWTRITWNDDNDAPSLARSSIFSRLPAASVRPSADRASRENRRVFYPARAVYNLNTPSPVSRDPPSRSHESLRF